MPSISATPAALTISGAEAATVPYRFGGTKARLTITAGSVSAGLGTGTSLSVTTPELDRLTQFDKLLNEDGTPSIRLIAIWQSAMSKIEEAFEALTTQVGDNTTLLSRITAAENLASAANDNATTASNTISIANSYVDPTGAVTAANDGSVTIAAHTRHYGNGDSASVNSGALSGFASGDYVTVYYVDAAREGGAVTYYGTTSAVSQTGNTHVVGQVTIPASGEPPATGTSTSAPGYTPSGSYDRNYIEP